jgi:hypothetical protein
MEQRETTTISAARDPFFAHGELERWVKERSGTASAASIS